MIDGDLSSRPPVWYFIENPITVKSHRPIIPYFRVNLLIMENYMTLLAFFFLCFLIGCAYIHFFTEGSE